jgi:RNA polymerase sigma factor (sigma-70 family)
MSELTMPISQESTEPNDGQLLSAFAQTGDHQAFRTLVQRHVGWVHAAAFRQLRDPHAAEDATQAVFVLLCQHAAKLTGKDAKVSGWLFLAVNYVVRSMKRSARRRSLHERKAALVRFEAQGTPGEAPLAEELDAAVQRLGTHDRSPIILRFYRGLEFAQVAQGLGVSEDAARKRVTRAIEKLRAKLGAPLSPQNVAAAAGVGLPLSAAALSAQISHAALVAVTGGTLSASVAAATKGALFLMAMTKAKIAASVVIIVLLATASTSVVIWELRQPADLPPATADNIAGDQNTPAPAAPAGQPPADQSADAPDPATATFEEVYALKGPDAIRRVLPPFPDARMDYYRTQNPTQAAAIPSGPDGMIIKWKDGKSSLWGMTFSGGRGFSVQDLTEYYLGAFGPEIEGDETLRSMRLIGDYVVRADSTKDQYAAALEKILSQETGSMVSFTFRQVERSVVVLRGKWNFTPAAPNNNPRQMEIFGRDLNTDMHRGGGGGGNVTELAGWVSRWINQQIIFECTDPPEEVVWHMNDTGNESRESRAKAKDPDLVITHLEEQTGLKASREPRQVRRLFIEYAAPTP